MTRGSACRLKGITNLLRPVLKCVLRQKQLFDSVSSTKQNRSTQHQDNNLPLRFHPRQAHAACEASPSSRLSTCEAQIKSGCFMLRLSHAQKCSSFCAHYHKIFVGIGSPAAHGQVQSGAYKPEKVTASAWYGCTLRMSSEISQVYR